MSTLILLAFFVHFSSSESLDQCTTTTKNYKKSWSKWVSDYQVANENFHECKLNQNEFLHCDYQRVIDQDLDQFQKISPEMIEKARKIATHPVTYYNVNGTLYKSASDCLFPARCQGVEYMLLKLAPKLPDFEIVVNNNDWPFVNKRFGKEPVPLLSFSKTSDYGDIFYPAWTFWAGGPAISKYPKGLGRWDLMRKNLLISAEKWPWMEKVAIAFFRGSRTSSQRDNLVLLSRKRPDLVDAAYTKNQAWKSKADTLGEDPAPEVTLEDHCKYKYLFNFRGVAASFRFKHLFLCGSLVLHVGEDWLEFFYPALKPWVHFVPLDPNFSSDQIQDLIEFLNAHDEIAKNIANKGKEFIRNWLRMKDVENYWTQLLKQYSKKMSFVPKPDPKTTKKLSK